MYTGTDNTQIETESGKNDHSLNHHEPTWKVKEQRRKFRKKIFGDHYNYNYRKPNQHKMYRIQQNRNTEIERQNRILLEKIQGIFKRSMGKKKIAMLKDIQTQETHDFVKANIVNARSRRSTETLNQKQFTKNPQEIGKSFQRSKRIQTEMQIQKKQKLHPQDQSRVTKKRRETEQPQPQTKRRKKQLHEVGHRVTLFKGPYQINKTPFIFTIFVEGQTYSIIAQQQNAQVQQQINIPYEDYKKLHKNYLAHNHAAILDYLHINLDTGLLELVGFESSMMDIVQYGEVKIGNKQEKSHKKNTMNLPTISTPHRQNFGTGSETGPNSSRLIKQLMQYQQRKEKRQIGKINSSEQKLKLSKQRKETSSNKRSCQFSISLVNVQILPQQAKEKYHQKQQIQPNHSSIHHEASNTQTVSMLPMFDADSNGHSQIPESI